MNVIDNVAVRPSGVEWSKSTGQPRKKGMNTKNPNYRRIYRWIPPNYFASPSVYGPNPVKFQNLAGMFLSLFSIAYSWIKKLSHVEIVTMLSFSWCFFNSVYAEQ